MISTVLEGRTRVPQPGSRFCRWEPPFTLQELRQLEKDDAQPGPHERWVEWFHRSLEYSLSTIYPDSSYLNLDVMKRAEERQRERDLKKLTRPQRQREGREFDVDRVAPPRTWARLPPTEQPNMPPKQLSLFAHSG